jgi:hypothetical protein
LEKRRKQAAEMGKKKEKKKKTEGAKLLGNELEEENRIERRKQGIA